MMAKLTDFKVLSFDVYGTMIDRENGILSALQPALERSGKTNMDPKQILKACSTLEASEQAEHPGRRYSELLTGLHPKLCKDIGVDEPTQAESKAYGESVKTWPAFPDSVAALKQLSKTYKMVVLSNVDNASFAANNAASLQGFEWDLVLTAEDIGSYKPTPNNFEYMLKAVKDRFGVDKGGVLQTAQSQFHDHHPAKAMGITSSWIYRPESVLGNRHDPVYNFKFDTLQAMADAVAEELEVAR